MRAVLSVIVMLTVSPVLAATALVCWSPERWGGSVNPLSILVMAAFGVITTPLWPTYIPAIIITPFIMRKIAARGAFKSLSLPAVLITSFVVGAIAGICVLAYSIVLSWHDSWDLVLNWASAGAVSGGITLALVSLIYRYQPRTA